MLGTVSLVNFSYEPHTVHVLVERDGEPVHWASYEASARTDGAIGGASVPCSWAGEGGRYTVHARLRGETEWRSLDLERFDSDVVAAELQVGDPSTGRGEVPELSVFTTTNPNERCSPSSPEQPTEGASEATTEETR